MAAEERWCRIAVTGNPSWPRHRIEIQFGAWRLRLVPATAMRRAALQIEIAQAHIDEAEARRIGKRFLGLLAHNSLRRTGARQPHAKRGYSL
jgi:hypothetical protein